MPDDLITADPADGGATRRKLLTGMGAAAAGGGLLALAGAQQAQAAVGNATYFSLGPLRIIDTRESGGRISGGQTRTLQEFEGSDDLTWAINLTVTSTKGSGYLSIYNADVSRPRPYSTINWRGSGKVVANFNIVDGGEAGLRVYCSGDSSNSTHFVIDVVGLFITTQAPLPPVVRAWQSKVQGLARKLSR